MSYSDLVRLYFERSNSLQWYWTLYVVVMGGLLAVASMRKQPDRITTILVTVLYLCFAYKNLGAICDVSQQQIEVLNAINATSPLLSAADAATAKLLKPTMITPELGGVRTFHASCDVLVVLTLWAMELRRRRSAQASA